LSFLLTIASPEVTSGKMPERPENEELKSRQK